MILTRIFGVDCTVDDSTWSSADRVLAAMLNDEEGRRQVGGGHDPDPDLSSAEHMVSRFSGRILDRSRHTPAGGAEPEDRIF